MHGASRPSVSPSSPQHRPGQVAMQRRSRNSAAQPCPPWSRPLPFPAKTPTEIITLLHREIVKLIALPDMKERMATLGFEPVGNTPDECAAQFRTELAKWAKVIREASIKAH